MLLCAELEPSSGKKIQLFKGDLSKIPSNERVDVLVVSAYPDDYTPTPTSLIGALHREGISVENLARDKFADLRQHFSCWLSQDLTKPVAALGFRRLLCFEPRVRGTPPELVGEIFQALAPFALGAPNVRSVAMPIVAAGDQGYSIGTMLPPLLEAAKFALRSGMPIDVIKLVVLNDTDIARAAPHFHEAASDLNQADPRGGHHNRRLSNGHEQQDRSTATKGFDTFISYSRADVEAAQIIREQLEARALSVFMDIVRIPVGASWLQAIGDAIDSSRSAVFLYSPTFLDSAICKTEFNTAFCRQLSGSQFMLFPLLVFDCRLPTYYSQLNYLDCRHADPVKLEQASQALGDLLR